jgi:hypothetical protein
MKKTSAPVRSIRPKNDQFFFPFAEILSFFLSYKYVKMFQNLSCRAAFLIVNGFPTLPSRSHAKMKDGIDF